MRELKTYKDVAGQIYEEQPNGSFVKNVKDRRNKAEKKAAKKALHIKGYYSKERFWISILELKC